MPQYRKLFLKIIESDDVNDMPDDFTRLAWTWLPLILCREGRCIDNAALVRSKLFPMRADVTADQVGAALDWFAARGMIVRYEVKGRRYFYVPSFQAYQGNTSRESPSNYPPPPDPLPDDGGATHDQLMSNSGVAPELLTTRSCSDADADADADAKADADADADAGAAAAGGPTRRVEFNPPDESEALRIWGDVGSGMSKTVHDELNVMVDECEQYRLCLPRGAPGWDVSGDGWVAAALHEASRSKTSARVSLNFLKSIVKRWLTEGFQAPFQPARASPGGNGHGSRSFDEQRKNVLEQFLAGGGDGPS